MTPIPLDIAVLSEPGVQTRPGDPSIFIRPFHFEAGENDTNQPPPPSSLSFETGYGRLLPSFFLFSTE